MSLIDRSAGASSIDPATAAGYDAHPARVGFFTDTSVCIGCKACEVACKEWNGVPDGALKLSGMSYDNTQGLGADTWRHVAFIEQRKTLAHQEPGQRGDFRWLMASDVCKHCTHAACLDVCPTGSLFRTEFGTVVVYDRLTVGMEPACAQACPTDSIQFGVLDELRERAQQRVERLHSAGVPDARLYGHDPNDGVGGGGAFFLLLDEPEAYGLPPDPVVTTRDLPAMWRNVGLAALTLAGTALMAFARRPR
jgi:formate dehydrogenase iron-sulfur subunit